jgi:hypothetical protein
VSARQSASSNLALLVERLKRPNPKPIDIAMMRLYVIANRRGDDDVALEAKPAERETRKKRLAILHSGIPITGKGPLRLS